MLENADILTAILHSRLDQNFPLCIEDTTKHHNFVLSWFCDNIPFLTALVTLNRYVIKDVKPVNGTTALLRNPFSNDSRFTEVTESIGNVDGWYLHYDPFKSKWIHSCKACGSSISQPKHIFMHRQREHRKGVEGAPILNFYSKYPKKQRCNWYLREVTLSI